MHSTSKYHTLHRSNCRGFGMIEILVAFVIVAVGILGLGTMQLFSLKNINNSQYRTLATLYAYDMAERMRSNKASLADYIGVNTTSGTPCGGCGVVADTDVDDWINNMSQSLDAGGLPNPMGTITTNGGLIEIRIQWDETTRDAAGGLVDTESYTLTVDV